MAKHFRNKERVVFTAEVTRQHPPYYEVKSMGVTTEYTDRLPEAISAFIEAPKYARTMHRIDVVGGRSYRKLIRENMRGAE